MKKATIGIVAHVDTGKTTLSESILYNTGVIKKIGRVDSMDTFLDTDHIEKERGITIYSKDARFSYNDIDFTLIDTPGHVDFSTEMERSLKILDAAILLISGSSSIQSHTKTLWTLLKSYRVPTFIFVNKMDMPGADKDKLMSDIHKTLSDCAIDFSSGKSGDFYENIATVDEALLEEYLESGFISDEHIISRIKNRQAFPVMFGSALKNEGVDDLLNVISHYLPLASDLSGSELGAYCYKISRDPSGVRLSHLKIFSGTLKVKGMLGDEKVNDIRLYSGSKYTSVSEVCAGDICAVAGLNNTKISDTYGCFSDQITPILAPALSYAVHYPDTLDNTVMLKNLRLLEEEDPSLNVDYNEHTREIFVSLMGDVQTEVLTRTIKERFGINVSFTDGKVCYKETVTRSVEGVGHFEPLRHYAEAHIRIEPLETGSGMQFESSISEDLLARNWQRLIYTHLVEREHRGVLTGSPLTDVKLSLVSGKAHIKHTEGGDFRQATYRAIRQGLMELRQAGGLKLLEPYYNYTLVLPDEYVGRAMTDITGMCGTVTISENDHENHISVLNGRAPVSTMNGYVKEVIAYTKGNGHLTCALAGYDQCHNEEEVLASTTYNPEADTKNPTSSVFCSHGAGTIIPWDQVPLYMHLSYASKEGALGDFSDNNIVDLNENEALRASYLANHKRIERSENHDFSISTEEVDSIIRSSSHANEKQRPTAPKPASTPAKPYKGAPIKPKYILVDGYNVIHAWSELSELAKNSLDAAVLCLNDTLCNYQAMIGIPLMVVYDAYKVKGHSTEERPYNNITIVYTKEAQTADRYIERYAHDNSKKYDITVVTSDGIEQIIVMGNGCHIMSSRELDSEIKQLSKSFNQQYGVK